MVAGVGGLEDDGGMGGAGAESLRVRLDSQRWNGEYTSKGITEVRGVSQE
jgi:hypothetical protein